MDDITRVCRKCGQEKPLSEFVKDKTCALGHRHTCKQCEQERYRKWRAANSEKRWEYNRKWHAANPEKIREYNRKWRAANPEKIREIRHKWREANTEKFLEMKRKYREELTDSYLIGKLKRLNLPVTPETIDYKRIQLKLYREIKKQQNDERD